MNVFFVIERFYPIVGGAENQAQRLGECLCAQGHTIRVITQNFGKHKSIERFKGMTIHRMHVLAQTKLSQVVFPIRVFFHILAHKRTVNVVHIHGINVLYGVITTGCWLLGVRTVMKIPTDGDVSSLKKFPLSKVWISLLKKTTMFVCINENIRNELQDLNIHNVRTIYNGVDTDKFYSSVSKAKLRKKLNIEQDSTVYLYTGRLVKRKNVQFLLEAFASLNDKDSVLVIVGSGALQPDSCEHELKEYVQKKKLNVLFAGEQKNVVEYLACADVFVFPSFREGLSNSILEAMSVGLPIIALNISGNKELLDDDTGLLVEQGDLQGFSSVMRLLKKNKKLAQTLAKNARKRALRDFSIKAITHKYEQLYEELVCNQRQ